MGLLNGLLRDARLGVGDLVYVVGGEGIGETGAAGLEEDGGGAFELEEELVQRRLVWNVGIGVRRGRQRDWRTYAVAPDCSPRPCAQMEEGGCEELPCCGFLHCVEEFGVGEKSIEVKLGNLKA